VDSGGRHRERGLDLCPLVPYLYARTRQSWALRG
jgi:hypothetical protein